MTYTGNIHKMRTEGTDPVFYFLTVGNTEISMNELIGKHIKIEYKNQINCISCNSITNKSFHQGYCYSCFVSLPQTDEGVLRPEKDMSHLGVSRDMAWAKEHSLIDHYVYLAITGNVKVGVTRYTQIPQRWIDQGAISAIKLAKTPYRNLAGQLEVEIGKHISDKTNWSKMLQTQANSIDLTELKKQIIEKIPAELKKYITFDNVITNIRSPFSYNIQKFKSLNMDSNNPITGKLSGIKGQYLIFDSGNVINIRKHNGYLIDMEII